MIVRARAAAVLVGATLLTWAQPLRPGPQVVTFLSDVDDTDQPYGLYLPKNYDASRKYPLVVSLHGEGSNHRLNLRRVFGKGNLPGESDSDATRFFPSLKDVNFIVASPLARGSMGYQGIAEKDVYDVVDDVKKRFSIDEDRVYLTGLSMGGGGALWLGLTRPDIWAAIAPVCAAAPDDATALAPNALNLRVHLFHGAADPTVPVARSREWNQRFKDLATAVEYTEYPNVRHNSWDQAYKDGAIFDWFAKFKRDRYPDRVRFVTTRYEYSTAYWVRIDSLTPSTLATIDARISGPNRIEVATSGLSAFTLELASHPKLDAKRPLAITVDGKRVAAGRGLTFVRRNGAWARAKFVAPKGAKRPGSEGPIRSAIASRHVYVYGTAGAPGEDELASRKAMAEKAAEWSAARSRLLVTFQVVADSQLKPTDIQHANLVLFGTKETNIVIQQMAEKLPFELNAGAADYGLVYVYPNGDHYVLINSGLPWWTGAERMPGMRLQNTPYRVLADLKDFLLFRGSIETPVAGGYFDNAWKVSASDASAMAATGAVKLKP